MLGRAFGTAGVLIALLAPGAHGQDTTGYCTPDGGPQGHATDAEHTVLLGERPLPPSVRSRRVAVGGVNTRVIEAGPAWAEDAVVFVHGNPDSARDWDDLVAIGGRFTRMIAFDVPGYGQSDKAAPAEVQTTNGVARYIQGLLDQLGVQRTVLVVHDFGGFWGLQWAAGHAGALRGAVLINGGALQGYLPHPDAFTWATPGVGEQSMAATTREGFVGRIKQGNPKMPEEQLNRMYDDYDRATRCAALRYYRSGSENYQTIGGEQAAALKPLDLPALVVWGEKDPYIPPEQAEKQKEAFPSARVVTFPESGHWPHFDDPERTRAEVVPFLRPRLGVAHVLGARRGSRALRVRVGVDGVVPAYRVAVRVDRAGKRLGASRRVRFVDRAGSLPVRLRRPLRPGRYTLTISGRGLPRATSAFRVR